MERLRVHDEAATQDAVFFRKGMVDADARAEAAERERDEALRGITEASMEWAERILAAEARVSELEEALREIADGNVVEWKLPTARDIARAALATASGKEEG